MSPIFWAIFESFACKFTFKIWCILGFFQKRQFLCKTAVATFYTTFLKFGLLLFPTSGHTGCGWHSTVGFLSLTFLQTVKST